MQNPHANETTFAEIQTTVVCPFTTVACENGKWRLLEDTPVFSSLDTQSPVIQLLPKGQIIFAPNGRFERGIDQVAHHIWMQVSGDSGLEKGSRGWARIRLEMIEAVKPEKYNAVLPEKMRQTAASILALTILALVLFAKFLYANKSSHRAQTHIVKTVDKIRLLALIFICLAISLRPYLEQGAYDYRAETIPYLLTSIVLPLAPMLLLIDGLIMLSIWPKEQNNRFHFVWLLLTSTSGLWILLTIITNLDLAFIGQILVFWLSALPFFIYLLFTANGLLDKRGFLIPAFLLLVISPFAGPFLTLPFLIAMSLSFYLVARKKCTHGDGKHYE